MQTRKVVVTLRRTCLACSQELEYVELRDVETEYLLDTWWQHTDVESLCSPEL